MHSENRRGLGGPRPSSGDLDPINAMKRALYELTESLRIAFTQIGANKLRSALTALGVIIGIVAVTLMGTAIWGIDAGVDRSFSGFGDDILYVTKWPWRDVDDWWNFRNRRPIAHD